MRSVHSDGHGSFRNDRVFVGEAVECHEIGLEVLDAMHVRAWFRDVDLGILVTLPDVDVSCFDPVPTKQTRRAS